MIKLYKTFNSVRCCDSISGNNLIDCHCKILDVGFSFEMLQKGTFSLRTLQGEWNNLRIVYEKHLDEFAPKSLLDVTIGDQIFTLISRRSRIWWKFWTFRFLIKLDGQCVAVGYCEDHSIFGSRSISITSMRKRYKHEALIVCAIFMFEYFRPPDVA